MQQQPRWVQILIGAIAVIIIFAVAAMGVRYIMKRQREAREFQQAQEAVEKIFGEGKGPGPTKMMPPPGK